MLITGILLSFSIALTSGATDYRRVCLANPGDEICRETAPIELVDRRFGGLPETGLSLFVSVTSGISWIELSDMVWAFGGVYWCIFISFIFIMFFSVLNIVTGVVVDGAIQRRLADRTVRLSEEVERRKEFLHDLLDLLELLDEDGSGLISAEEWSHCLNSPSVASSIELLGISTNDTQVLFELLDVDGDRQITICELVEGFSRMRGNATSLDAHQLLKRVNHCISHIEWICRKLNDGESLDARDSARSSVYSNKTRHSISSDHDRSEQRKSCHSNVVHLPPRPSRIEAMLAMNTMSSGINSFAPNLSGETGILPSLSSFHTLGLRESHH